MGCAGSKLEELEAVVLCRDRSRLLAEAISYRYALADAHAAYSRSLRSVGESLRLFLSQIEANPAPPAPHLPLPSSRKGDNASAAAPHLTDHSHSSSGSHIHLHSDSDDLESDDDDDFSLHSDDDELHLHHEEASPPAPTVSYAKNQPPNSSVSYERPQMSPEIVHFGGGGGAGEASTSSSSYYGYSYDPPPQNPNFYPYPYGYASNYNGYGEGAMSGYFGSSASPPAMPRMGPASPPPQATPPPPSPPKTSTWDFLNPFENYESYYATYTPSRSSREVREEEDIPDLEDDDSEVVKDAYDDDKNPVGSAGPSPDLSKEERVSKAGEEPQPKRKSVDVAGTSGENAGAKVEKEVVADEVKRQPEEPQQSVAAFPVKRYHDAPQVVQEIKSQFDRASESVEEVSKMLEVGKHPYHRKKSVYKVSSRMICGINSLSSSKDEFLVFEDDKAMGSGNLSSTLQKLYIWEKKLYDEVMVEEKMRVLHDRKCREMKRLDKKGAEAHKLDSTLAAVRKLSTKIRIAIQVVDSISEKISKLRDEELWPQISELIQGLMRMWSVTLECHHIQCQALSEAQSLESFAFGGKISDAHMDVTKQLELELLEWVASFSAWIHAQRSYVRALNGWLVIGLRYVPEETADGVAPFSPGRLGAPPVFVICHQWAQTMERISEKEVIDAMQAFASNVLHLWEQHNFEQRQRLMANRDMERTLRIMEREEQEMHKFVEAQNKKLVLFSGDGGLALFKHDESGNLQANLRQVFEAMENFSASTLKAYEELNRRAEEERLARENEKVT